MAANKPPARGAEGEVSERDFQRTINSAIANTEDEIFKGATGDDLPEHDGDTSLEDMGEGLEGEPLEDEGDEAEEGDDDGQEADAEAGEAEEGEVKREPVADPRDQRGQQRRDGQREPAVPPGRLREETARAKTAETEAAALRRELAETRGRLDEVSRRVNAPAPQPAKEAKADPEPDMFADPDGWKAWNRRQAEQIADERAQRVLGSYRQEQQQQFEQRLNSNMEQAATGPRGLEFNAAYRALTSLDPRDSRNVSMVRELVNSPNPAQAVLDWFEDNGAQEFRDSILAQLMPQQPRQGGRQQQQQRSPQQQQPRQVYRGAQPLRSLNGAQGSNSQRVGDPEMLDGSDGSVFEYATRR